MVLVSIKNQYDSRVQLEDLVDFSMIDKDSKSEKSSAQLDIKKLKSEVNRHCKECTNANITKIGGEESPPILNYVLNLH